MQLGLFFFKSWKKSEDVRLKLAGLLEDQLKEQKTLIKMLEKNKLSSKDRQTVLDTLKQLTNSIDQRRSSIKALEQDREMSLRRIAKVIIISSLIINYIHIVSIICQNNITIISQNWALT